MPKYIKRDVEEKDAPIEEKKIKLCKSGGLICDSKYLFECIGKINNNNNQKEKFLTDVCEIAFKEKKHSCVLLYWVDHSDQGPTFYLLSSAHAWADWFFSTS